MFPERIETHRLVLERLCHETLDLFEFYRVCSDADGTEQMSEVTHYMPWNHTITREEYRTATG
jgi:ribosomal-protein-alanine N-acetyltransferase